MEILTKNESPSFFVDTVYTKFKTCTFFADDYFYHRDGIDIKDKNGKIMTIIDKNERKVFTKLIWRSTEN